MVRDPEGNIIDPDSTGAIQLYRRVSLLASYSAKNLSCSDTSMLPIGTEPSLKDN